MKKEKIDYLQKKGETPSFSKITSKEGEDHRIKILLPTQRICTFKRTRVKKKKWKLSTTEEHFLDEIVEFP